MTADIEDKKEQRNVLQIYSAIVLDIELGMMIQRYIYNTHTYTNEHNRLRSTLK